MKKKLCRNILWGTDFHLTKHTDNSQQLINGLKLNSATANNYGEEFIGFGILKSSKYDFGFW